MVEKTKRRLRMDKKEMVFKWIKMNHSDGLTESELTLHFEKDDIKRGLIKAFLEELIKEKRITFEIQNRSKIYKEIKNEKDN